MNTYMQISALFYVLLIAVVYFRKRKINTMENIVFKLIIIHNIITILADLASRVYAVYFQPTTAITEALFKLLLWCLANYTIIFSYYVYCISSKKNAGMVAFEDNPNKKHFQTRLRVTLVWMLLTLPLIFCAPVKLHVVGIYFTQEGPALIIAYAIAAVCAFSWAILLFLNREKIKGKQFIPIYVFSILSVFIMMLQVLKPEICFVTPGLSIITLIMYFTLENPDLQIVEELGVAKEEAENANRAKTDFLSSMSHEIRTPLNAIVGFSQALAKEDISGTAKEEVRDIIMASNGLLEIVNGILDISKIEANKIEIVNDEYSSRKLIHEIITLVNARIGSKPLELKVELDENLPPVLYGDAMRIKQIIINLLTNAVKYTNEGYIRLSIKCSNLGDTSHITVSVEDSGMGMTEKDLEQLFTKFQRFDMDKNINVEGTGLGMAITKGLIELMDGHIDVKSEYGKGSIFTVTFEQKIIEKDLQETIENQTEENAAIEPFNAEGQKILIVDDNKINLKVAARLLREYNVTIELVDNGPECIKRILDGKEYDLIFLDIMMPKMKGTEVLFNLKNIVGFKTPVVALTADVISGMEEKYISQGFDDCLPKPIVEEDLYYTLKKYLKETKPENEPSNAATNQATENKTAILEAAGINVAQGIELLKDIEMYDATLEEFYIELPDKLTELNEFIEHNDLDNYGILAHGLKSEARYVGCNELGDLAYEHEMAGKEKNMEFIKSNFNKLKEECNRVYTVIKEYFGK